MLLKHFQLVNYLQFYLNKYSKEPSNAIAFLYFFQERSLFLYLPSSLQYKYKIKNKRRFSTKASRRGKTLRKSKTNVKFMICKNLKINASKTRKNLFWRSSKIVLFLFQATNQFVSLHDVNLVIKINRCQFLFDVGYKSFEQKILRKIIFKVKIPDVRKNYKS